MGPIEVIFDFFFEIFLKIERQKFRGSSRLGWGIFSKMLPSFPPQFLRVFEGDPQKTLKANPHSHLEILALNLKNSALILTSNFEGF